MKRNLLMAIIAGCGFMYTSAQVDSTSTNPSDTAQTDKSTKIKLGDSHVVTITKTESKDSASTEEKKRVRVKDASRFIVTYPMMMDFQQSISRSDELSYLDLDLGLSAGFSWTFIAKEHKLIGHAVRLGWALEWEHNKYRLKNSVAPVILPAGEFGQHFLTAIPNYVVKKNRLNVNYLNLPVKLVFDFNQYKEGSLRIGVGGFVGVRAKAKNTIVYEHLKSTTKMKIKDPFNLSRFQYGVMGEIGFGDWFIYGKYAMNDMFEDPKDLRNVTIGVGWALY